MARASRHFTPRSGCQPQVAGSTDEVQSVFDLTKSTVPSSLRREEGYGGQKGYHSESYESKCDHNCESRAQPASYITEYAVWESIH